MTIALLFFLIACLLVAPNYVGFRSQRPAHFAETGPAFDPRHDLSGPILCEGVIYGPTGRISSRFVAEMDGVWEGNRCVLNEVFRYDNGDQQDRQWRFSLGNDGMLRAEADDVVGVGTGTVSGSTVQMLYKLRLPSTAGGHVVSVTDWMYKAPNGTIVNRSQFHKFGIKVAELVATMRPVQT